MRNTEVILEGEINISQLKKKKKAERRHSERIVWQSHRYIPEHVT